MKAQFLPHGLVLAVLVCLAVVGPAGAQQQPAFSDEAVNEAIEQGRRYLWSRWNQDHCWESRDRALADQMETIDHANFGGRTALAAYALLASGESYQKPEIARTLEWLADVDMVGTYALGMRCNVWGLLPENLGRRNLSRDVRQIVNSMPLRGNNANTYHYWSTGEDHRPFGTWDNSNGNYAVLGVWAGLRNNVEVPLEYWRRIEQHWREHQNADGGWTYRNASGDRTGSMTTAGIATLFICFDALYAEQFEDCRGEWDYPPIDRAMAWMDRNFTVERNPGFLVDGRPQNLWHYYYLYNVERVGLASGYKFFNQHDWYREGAELLLRRQQGDGGWHGNVRDTAWAILFLTRGQKPVLFNWLQHPGDWRNRPRALANLTAWASRTFEKELNWQIIDLRTDVSQWHDAPILYVTGSEAVEFSDEHVDKLREFVWQGGTILSVEECRGQEFTRSMQQAYAALFPEYELVTLDMTHPIFSAHFPLRRRFSVQAISNGARLLAIHVQDDLVRSWQTNASRTQRLDFELGANIYFYVTDHGIARNRGTSMWPEPTRQGSRTIRLARLRHSGIYDPEPLAWQRFARMLAHEQDVRLEVSEPMAIAELDAETHPVAHLTGTTGFNLSDEEIAALQTYCRAGGRLIVDACGGNENFIESFEQVAPRIFEGDQTLRPLASTSEVYRLDGLELNEVDYRRAAGAGGNQPRLRALMLDDELVGLWSVEDLTAGLVGYQQFELPGYAPGLTPEEDSAYRVMRNCVLWAADQ